MQLLMRFRSIALLLSCYRLLSQAGFGGLRVRLEGEGVESSPFHDHVAEEKGMPSRSKKYNQDSTHQHSWF